MSNIHFLVMVFVLTFSSCVSDVANRYYSKEHYPARNPKDIELLWEKPAVDFEIVAEFQARGETPKGMRRRAAKIGVDAVIVTFLGGEYSEREQWADKDRSKTYSRIIGTAIRYKK